MRIWLEHGKPFKTPRRDSHPAVRRAMRASTVPPAPRMSRQILLLGSETIEREMILLHHMIKTRNRTPRKFQELSSRFPHSSEAATDQTFVRSSSGARRPASPLYRSSAFHDTTRNRRISLLFNCRFFRRINLSTVELLKLLSRDLRQLASRNMKRPDAFCGTGANSSSYQIPSIRR